MPQTLTVGHRSLLALLRTWLLQRLGREPEAWPPRHRVARSLLG